MESKKQPFGCRRNTNDQVRAEFLLKNLDIFETHNMLLEVLDFFVECRRAIRRQAQVSHGPYRLLGNRFVIKQNGRFYWTNVTNLEEVKFIRPRVSFEVGCFTFLPVSACQVYLTYLIRTESFIFLLCLVVGVWFSVNLGNDSQVNFWHVRHARPVPVKTRFFLFLVIDWFWGSLHCKQYNTSALLESYKRKQGNRQPDMDPRMTPTQWGSLTVPECFPLSLFLLHVFRSVFSFSFWIPSFCWRWNLNLLSLEFLIIRSYFFSI